MKMQVQWMALWLLLVLPMSLGYHHPLRYTTRRLRTDLLSGKDDKIKLNINNLLDNAKKLRSEAQEYELLQAMNSTLGDDKMGSVDGNNEFVSTIVIEKNASQLKNVTTYKLIEVKDVAVAVNDTKKSVLVDRTLESTKKKRLLDQLSGYTTASTSKVTTFGDQLLTSYTKVAQDDKLDHDQDLNTTYVTHRINMIIDKLNVTLYAEKKIESIIDASYSKDDDIKYLPTIDELYKGLKPWWFRMLIKGLAPNLLTTNSYEFIDKKILELALLLEIRNVTETIESLSVSSTESSTALSSSYDNDNFLDAIYNDLSNIEARMLARYNRIVISSGLSDNLNPVELEYVDDSDEEISLQSSINYSSVTSYEASALLDEIEIFLGKILSRVEDIKLNTPEVTDISEADKSFFVYELKRILAILPYLDDTSKNSDFNFKVKDIMETVECIWLFCDANSESDISARAIKSLDPSSAISAATAIDLFNSMNVSSIIKSNMNFLNGGNKLAAAAQEEASVNSSAERLIVDYFDPTSRRNGLALSKEGAGQFQGEILKDLFTVTAVIKSQGAVIFEGNSMIKDTSVLAAKIEEKYLQSDLSQELKYTIIMNEKYPSLEGGIQQAALESMLGSSPAVVVFPSSWNTYIQMSKGQGAGKVWANLLTATSILLSGLYSAGCFNLFQNGEFAVNGVPDDFLPLAIAPIAISAFANLIEKIIAKMKGIDMTSLLIPTMSVFTFGTRSTYLNMPKSRSDIFDTSFAGTMVSLIASITVLITGIYFTTITPNEVLQTYPTVSLSLLTTNKIIEELILYNFPTILSDNLDKGVDTMIHMHWMAIAGGLSFIASTLQLIPLDNSSGSKMTYAVLGRENFFLFSIISALIKLAYILPTLFNFSTTLTGIKMLRTRLFLDYVISSQICSNAGENQIAVDNITDITETRKIAYFFMVFLLLFSYFPYLDIVNDITGLFTGLIGIGGSSSTLPLI